MTVYVDEFPGGGWGKWNGGAHMLASDINELHVMAKIIGLKRSWFQDSTFPHYDLTRSKRVKAIDAGAISIDIGEIPEDVLMRCMDGTYESHKDRKERWQKKHGKVVSNMRTQEA